MTSVLVGPDEVDGQAGTRFFSIGDSIFNYTAPNHWGYEWPRALEANGQVSSGIDADSGRSINRAGSIRSGLEAVSHNANAIAGSDAVITNLGVNDGERGGTWEALARNFVGALRDANPDVLIVWITPVAEPGVAPAAVIERAADHAATLRVLRSEGVIDLLVEWDHHAVANPEVFHDDGVHYWVNGDTAAYATFAASAVAHLGGSSATTTTAPTTTAPTTTAPTTTAPTTTAAPATTKPTTRAPSTAVSPTEPVPTAPPVEDPASSAVHCGGPGLPWQETDRPLDATIDRLYQIVLARQPTESDLAYWAGQNADGSTVERVVGAVLRSEEARTLGFGVSIEGDRQLLAANLDGLLQTPLSLATTTDLEVLRLLDDADLAALLGTAAPQSAVDGQICRLYLAAFGRSPDASGLVYWRAAGGQSQVVAGIGGSAEFLSLHPESQSASEFIDDVYQRVLGRSADPEGRHYWLSQLEAGLLRSRMMLLMSNSREFILLTNTVR